jgi:hypothetical protein
MPIIVNVDVMLARRKMRLNTLAELGGPRPSASVPSNGCVKCSIASQEICWLTKKKSAAEL